MIAPAMANRSSPQTFAQLIDAEERCFSANSAFAEKPEITSSGSADEPWVSFAPQDRAGIAFSGGGIRSATFNLGVLQALHRLDLLRHFDYLATVSGGGYVGAWWSAWLARARQGGALFPVNDAGESETREPDEIRHLREFSNFLSPRIGLFETEMWSAVLAVLSAMLPALVVANSLIVIAVLAWVALAIVLMPGTSPVGPVGAAIAGTMLIVAVQIAAEVVWCRKKKAEVSGFPVRWWVLLVVLGTGASFLAWWLLFRAAQKVDSLGIDVWPHSFNRDIFAAPIVWIITVGVLLVARIIALRFRGDDPKRRVYIATADRILQRFLAAALVWSVIACIWLIGAWLQQKFRLGGLSAVTAAFASSGLFALLRNWFVSQLTSGKKSGPASRLKPLLPQLLAYLTLILGAIGVCAGLSFGLTFGGWNFFGIALGAALFVVLFCIVFFDPALVSMHAFYRNRLARAYLGASNPKNNAAGLPNETKAARNRQVDLRADDDCAMQTLAPKNNGALHLVCCAANDVGGDSLGTLARGSRSAVLSPIGFAIGNYWRGWGADEANNVTVASAITASAAAFNSNMGSISKSLGPAVTFLMTALNLRLGLWLRHPLSRGDLKVKSGWLFLREMFGATKCGPPISASDAAPQPPSDYVHLSDGAHFENLALYELVRRHCRYILLCDCGGDPSRAFDDLGNALRRIREDFGVEIELDLEAIRPDPLTMLSRQHMVVGSIYYDTDHTDIGVLLYFKPTLTGDEPSDVTQYGRRNTEFPHESTGDQFYDEAQWESYRRLGEHAAQSSLRFLERNGRLDTQSVDDLFVGARLEWYPAPSDLAERVGAAMERIGELERQLAGNESANLRRELFPELSEFARSLGEPDAQGETESGVDLEQARATEEAPTLREIEYNLPVVLAVFRIMQGAWLSCYLDTHLSHPLNVGLFNQFQRWAYAPSCRLWWPLLRPMYGSRFRRFMEEHLSLRDADHPELRGEVRGPLRAPPEGLARMHWLRARAMNDRAEDGDAWFEYVVHLPVQRDGSRAVERVPIQLGLARTQMTAGELRWSSNDFFVPPSLWGSGTGGVFLRRLLDQPPVGVREFVVQLEKKREEDETRSDFASRQERTDLIAFYSRAGFAARADGNEMIRVVAS